MNATEKLILEGIVKSLKESTTASWDTGDVYKWKDFACKMRTTIQNSTNIINQLLKVPDDENINSHINN